MILVHCPVHSETHSQQWDGRELEIWVCRKIYNVVCCMLHLNSVLYDPKVCKNPFSPLLAHTTVLRSIVGEGMRAIALFHYLCVVDNATEFTNTSCSLFFHAKSIIPCTCQSSYYVSTKSPFAPCTFRSRHEYWIPKDSF